MNRTIEITVNTVDEEQHFLFTSTKDLFNDVHNSIERCAQRYPRWTSMVVTFTNPQKENES